MTLNKNDLTQGVLDVISVFPATSDAAGNGLANAYHSYASQGESCASLNPTVVNLPGLQDGLKDTLGEPFPADAEESAEAWRDALVIYWTGALFGPLGTVTLPIAGAPAFKSALQALFETQAIAIPPVPFPVSADALATLIDTFTKTITVTDTGFPCGPLPIT